MICYVFLMVMHVVEYCTLSKCTLSKRYGHSKRCTLCPSGRYPSFAQSQPSHTSPSISTTTLTKYISHARSAYSRQCYIFQSSKQALRIHSPNSSPASIPSLTHPEYLDGQSKIGRVR